MEDKEEDKDFEIVTEEEIRRLEDHHHTSKVCLNIEEIIEEALHNEEENFFEEEKEKVIEELSDLEEEFKEWTKIRLTTISKLREIADAIQQLTKRSTTAKIIGSGGGALAGGLTVVGGILTIASAGAAFPILVAGTGLGLISGVTGGAAAVTEKIMKSRQMKEVDAALASDQEATKHLEEKVDSLRQKPLVRQIASDVILSGAGAASDSFHILGLVAHGGAAGTGETVKLGIEATAKLLGEDVSKEVSRVLLHTSGRLLSGTVTVVFGGVTLIYDVYKLRNELGTLAQLGEEGASEIRTIAEELEASLKNLSSLNDDDDF